MTVMRKFRVRNVMQVLVTFCFFFCLFWNRHDVTNTFLKEINDIKNI